MKRLKCVAILFLLLCISGCTQIRPYPFCVFGPDPRIQTDRQLSKKIEEFVRGVAGNDARVEISPNQRVVVVETDELRHEALRKLWPSAACIGQTRYDTEYAHYKACVYSIEQGLKNNDGSPILGKWSDSLTVSTVYCGQSIVQTPETEAPKPAQPKAPDPETKPVPETKKN